MKIIYNKYLPPKGYAAIIICGVVFARSESKPLKAHIVTHEAIHAKQMRELLIMFFYLWYVIEWLVRLIQYRNQKEAYRNISLEREAYSNERNERYLKNRKMYSFIRYLKRV